MRKAVAGMDVVISTANGIVPQRSKANAATVNGQALRLIEWCEQAGVGRFVQSSVPTYLGEGSVPELHGKRLIEKRLFCIVDANNCYSKRRPHGCVPRHGV